MADVENVETAVGEYNLCSILPRRLYPSDKVRLIENAAD